MKKVIIAVLALMVLSAGSFAASVPAVTKSTVSTSTSGMVKTGGIFGKHHHKKHHHRIAKAAF